MSDQDEAVAITIVGETQAPDLLVEGNAELFVRNTDGSEEAPPPALPAGPRPVDENAALPADYPARGGVPQCLAAQPKPRALGPNTWEVPMCLAMEAFWCVHGPPSVTRYNFCPAENGKGKPRTRKKKALVSTEQFHGLCESEMRK